MVEPQSCLSQGLRRLPGRIVVDDGLQRRLLVFGNLMLDVADGAGDDVQILVDLLVGRNLPQRRLLLGELDCPSRRYSRMLPLSRRAGAFFGAEADDRRSSDEGDDA